MIEIKTKKVQYLNPEDEGHRAFVEWVAHFTKDDIAALFADPADYGEDEKIDHLPTQEMQRDAIAHRESYARSKKAEDDYRILCDKLTALRGFEALKTPILNSEMKPILKSAFMMVMDRTNDIEVMSHMMDVLAVVDPDYFPELLSTQKAKDKERVQRPNPSSYFKPLPTPPTKPTIAAAAKPKSTPVNVFDCLQADSGEVLKKTSPHGFNAIEHKANSLALENVNGKVEKKPEAMRLKDSHGHYIDFFKDGSAKTSQYELTDDVESVASKMLKALLTMLNVYMVLCEQKGLEAVLPKGEMLNPTFSVVKSSENSEKVRNLIVKKLERELLHSDYDIIRDRMCFDGKKLLPGLPPKEKQEVNEPCSIRFCR